MVMVKGIVNHYFMAVVFANWNCMLANWLGETRNERVGGSIIIQSYPFPFFFSFYIKTSL